MSEADDHCSAKEICMKGIDAGVGAGEQHTTVSVFLLEVLIGEIEAECVAEARADAGGVFRPRTLWKVGGHRSVGSGRLVRDKPAAHRKAVGDAVIHSN